MTVLAVLSGCGDELRLTDAADAASDVSPSDVVTTDRGEPRDAGVSDTQTPPDAPDGAIDAPDVGVDVGADTVSDVVVDAANDVVVDAASDVVVDAASDVLMDAASDVARDVAPDLAVDVTLDAGVDVRADGGADAAVDAAPDGPVDDIFFADVRSTVVPCALADGDPRREAVETRCDGVDNDCDGHIDRLIPTAANACVTGLRGLCANGFAACDGATRVCLGPSASPEVTDGADNDCNGTVDDVPAVSVRPRALMLVPDDLWTDGPTEIDHVASVLEQWGVPYDRPSMSASWSSQLASIAGNYALVIIPGYLGGYMVDAATRTALEDFVRQGGVVIVHKPVAAGVSTELLRLTGLTASVRRRDATLLRFTSDAPATRSLDSLEERVLPIVDDTARTPIEVYTVTPDATAGTSVLARAFVGAMDVGAVVTRRPLGRGAVYAVGHDLHSFEHYRCYINCFEPAGDVLGLFYRDALREGASGHVVFKHTVPGVEDSLLLLTHDIDAPEAEVPGALGPAGASQMASVEARHRARGTYFVTTDFVSGYWWPDTIRYLCALGMCPAGAHSVRHVATSVIGTCTESYPSYSPRTNADITLCGEIRVSQQLLASVTGSVPRAWRSPYLTVNPMLFDLLSAQGVIADSSYAIGDYKTNLPISTARTGLHQEVFHHRPMYEHLIAIEDGMGTISGGMTTREELQASNVASFLSSWSYVMLRNLANDAFTVGLIHPSGGVGVPLTNMAYKLSAADRLLDMADRAHVRTDVGVEALTDFWRARESATLDVTYDAARGYRGTLTAGAYAVSGLTLEFGDAVTSFVCDACGPFTIAGRRVVLRGPIAAGVRASFTAR